ncbi:uncharacterized protein ACBT57_013395 [Dama dama]
MKLTFCNWLHSGSNEPRPLAQFPFRFPPRPPPPPASQVPPGRSGVPRDCPLGAAPALPGALLGISAVRRATAEQVSSLREPSGRRSVRRALGLDAAAAVDVTPFPIGWIQMTTFSVSSHGPPPDLLFL